MSSRSSGRILKIFNQFKEDCKLITLESKTTGKKVKMIKYKEKIYRTGSMSNAFSMAREAGDLIIPDKLKK
jgi:hypothetical protein